MFKDKRHLEILSIITFFFSIILLLSLISYNTLDYQHDTAETYNLIGPFGAWISNFLRTSFGYASYLFIILFVIIGCEILINKNNRDTFEKIFSIFFLIITASAFISLFKNGEYQYSGGFTGFFIYKYLRIITGKIGSALIIIILNIVALILTGLLSMKKIIENKSVNLNMIKKIKFKLNNSIFKDEWEPDVPFNFIEEELFNPGVKIPWITKKKISLRNKSDKINKSELIKYLEMPVNYDKKIKEENIESSKMDETLNFDYNINENKPESYGIRLENDSQNDNADVTKEIVDIDYIEYDEKINNIVNNKKTGESFIKIPEAIPVNKGKENIIDTAQSDSIEFDRIKNINLENANESTLKVDIQNDESKNNLVESVLINKDYIIPSNFLKLSTPVDTESWQNEIRKNSVLLVNTLADFGIESKVINVNRGPVITLYEVQIASGIKVNKIVCLSDDIAMALAALRVRIVAPIPGKSAIGVEIPNQHRENVTLGDIVKTSEFQKNNDFLKFALGKDILGNPVTIDLKKMPHLLIAGATGSGKSVCVNTIISSLIYSYDPNYLRFILIDPKMVELQIYNGSPHLLTPVITEARNAQIALKWTIFEMDRRYRLLSEHNCRDLQRFNEQIQFEKSKVEKLPYIVTIIDELADLMMVASKEIEGYITRIAQKARAVGIHLVLATQRPSVDVITGIIKANFPARIAFQVTQKNDSRTILDQNGAEKLLGKGDMLYQSPVSSFPIRVQGSYISEEEIINLVKHLNSLCKPMYIDIEECVDEITNKMEKDNDGDELMVEALKIVEETRKASASYLQRRLSIGYNRAARIIEHMEELGYVGPQQGSKPREVFI